LFLSLIAILIADEYQLDGRPGLVVVWGYGLIAAIGVWNSAAQRIKSAIWMDRMPGYLARFVVFMYAAKIILGLMNGDALRLLGLLAR